MHGGDPIVNFKYIFLRGDLGISIKFYDSMNYELSSLIKIYGQLASLLSDLSLYICHQFSN